MKRVFVIDEHISSRKNGVGTYMKHLLSCMKELKVEVNFLSFNDEERFFSIFEENGDHYYNFPMCNGGDMLESGAMCWPILKIYVSDAPGNIFFVNHSPCVDFLKTLRRHYRRSKIVFTIHDQGWTAPLLGDKERLREVVGRSYPRLKKYGKECFCKDYFRQERQMYRIADKVVCLSATTRELLTSLYEIPSAKIHLIPNGIPATISPHNILPRQQLRRELGITDEERVLLFVGRTVKAKGIGELLEAFEQLCHCHRHLRLVVAGAVYNLKDFANLTPQSAPRIAYVGQIPPERLQAWYCAADIGVLPSYTEQCSYTGLEMMAAGLLVVATDGNGLTDTFHHNINALVASVKPNLAESLEHTLDEALGLPEEERESIRRRAVEYVQTHYSLARMREGYRQLLS